MQKRSLKVGIMLLIFVMMVLTLQVTTAVAKEKVKIAFIGPLTGSVANMGQGARNSFQLAVNQYNKGVFGETKYEYEMVAYDDECASNTAVRTAQKVTSDPSIVGAVAHYCSMAGISAKPIYERNGFPILVWGAVLPDITHPSSKYINRVCGTQREQNEFIADWLTEFLPEFYDVEPKTYVTICDSSDYGQGMKEFFTESIESRGGEIIENFDIAVGQKDFSTELTKTKELDPDVVYYGMIAPEVIYLREQYTQHGLKQLAVSCSGGVNEALVDSLDEDQLEGFVAFNETAPYEMYPGGEDFINAYREMDFDLPAEAYGIYSYTGALMLMDAIEQVGPDRSKVADIVSTYNVEESPIGPIEMDEYGQNMVQFFVYVGEDGGQVIWPESKYADKDRILPGIEYLREKNK